MEQPRRQKSDESPIFSILPERSDFADGDSYSSFGSNWDCSQSSSHTNLMSKSDNLNFNDVDRHAPDVIASTQQSIVPAMVLTKASGNGTLVLEESKLSTAKPSSMNDEIGKKRQFLLLALLEQVASLHDATPRTFAVHVMHLLENGIIEPSTVRHLFDYHGLIPKSSKEFDKDKNKKKREKTNVHVDSTPLQSVDLNNTITRMPIQHERDVQLAILRQFFISQPTRPSNTNSELQKVSTLPSNMYLNQLQLKLHPNLFSLQNHPLLTSRSQRDFHHISFLSSGSFGSVYHVQNKLDSVEYALKQIYFKNKGFDQDMVEKVLREVRCLAQLDHMHCVRYYTSWLEPCWNSNSNINSSVRNHGTNRKLLLTLTEDPDHAMSSAQNNIQTSLRNNEEAHISDSEQSWEDGKNQIITVLKKKKLGFNEQVKNDKLEMEMEEYGEGSDYSDWSQNLDSNYSEWSKEGSQSSGDQSYNCPPDQKQKETKTQAQNPPSFHYQICLYIQMELCKSSTLLDWIDDRNENYRKELQYESDYQLNRLRSALTIMKQIASGLDHIHSKNIVHRDLKPANIFSCKNVPNIFKIGDFGLSKIISTPPSKDTDLSNEFNHLKYSNSADMESQMKKFNTLGIGTASYASPEQISSSTYCTPSDIYSLGLIFLELVGNYQTAHERARAFDAIRKERNVMFLLSYESKVINGKYSDKKANRVEFVLEKLEELILSMTDAAARKRPIATAILQVVEEVLILVENTESSEDEGDNLKVEELQELVENKEMVIENQKKKIKEMEEMISCLKSKLALRK